MAWTAADLKIFAAGLAIGGKYNHTQGNLPKVMSSVPSGTYSEVFYITLSCIVTEATIFYSTDGTTPRTVYDGSSIYIDKDSTVLAFAAYGEQLSGMSKFVYIIYIPAVDEQDVINVADIADTVATQFITGDVYANSDTIAIHQISDAIDIDVRILE